MAKKPSLVDEVLARAVSSRPGFRTWFDRLPADARAELDAVKQAFVPTVHKKSTYAKAIIAAATERGWEVAGVQGVVAWLNRR